MCGNISGENQSGPVVWLKGFLIPFQRLPNVAREKMCVSGPVSPGEGLLVYMFLWVGGWRILVTDQVLRVAVSEDHSPGNSPLLNEGTAGEDEWSPGLSLTRLTGGDSYIQVLNGVRNWIWCSSQGCDKYLPHYTQTLGPHLGKVFYQRTPLLVLWRSDLN